MKKIFQNIKQNLKLILGFLIIGFFLGWLIFHQGDASSTSTNEQELSGHEGHDHESEDPTIWTCSMHPQIKQDHPGKCPICAMDLIPLVKVSSTTEDVNPNEIVMTESAAKLAEIQSVIVKRGVASKDVYLQGKVQADERRIAELTARFGGRIEKLFVNFTGQHVTKGEKLATLYSPNLISAQRELLEAISFKESRPSLYNAAKGKLKLWDLSDEQITAIEEKGEPMIFFDVLSPVTGTVTMRHVALGDYIKEGSALFQVIDLTSIWVLFDAYESDLPWINLGDKLVFTVPSLPGKKYSARISFIDPFINPVTRVAKIRLEISNRKMLLKPEMFANGIVTSRIAKGQNEILIPKSAVLWTGKRAVVYVKVVERENPSFLYREVVLGPEAGAFYVIAEGLEEGEVIAVNGVFKIDAAAQLQGLPSMMNPEGGKVSTGHNHGGMKMSDEEMAQMESEPAISQVDNMADMEEKKTDTILPEYPKFDVDQSFRDQLAGVFSAYIKMKDGFVQTNPKKVRKSAQKLQDKLSAVDMELLNGDAHMFWMDQLNILKDKIKNISDSKDIEIQRKAFSSFNGAFYASAKAFGISGNQIYYQYCPMAFDNRGAYWLSDRSEILNPYFGDVMLSCGETKDTIK